MFLEIRLVPDTDPQITFNCPIFLISGEFNTSENSLKVVRMDQQKEAELLSLGFHFALVAAMVFQVSCNFLVLLYR